ncbi:hypothetical protein K435DRAFT_806617 [Dendrothele bispora CBS 962.96]|uniref:Uncharacterized protein n=1 Tax=Dendrothele bispora (strain CBS 962.96) TaxID=1314807 RepID=A0A4S8L7Y0_DENBC|nr:hypothetical protein K435DRAFT_806617 [Dendrothele bispora CBS 962.96]
MAVPPPFMSQPLRRNNGQRQVASSPPPQPTNSSETCVSASQRETRSSPPPSDSRSFARQLSEEEDVCTGSKRVHASTGGQRKRRKKSAPKMTKYMHAAQWHYRTVSPYIPISTLFRVAHAADDPEDPFTEEMSDEEISWHVDAYNLLLKRVSGFKSLVESLRSEDTTDKLDDMLNWLDGSDTNLLRSKVLVYMLDDPLLDTLDPPLSAEEPSKANRGYKHDYTAELLCPRNLRKSFLKDKKKVKNKMSSGHSKVNNSSLPFFCYDRELYDNKDPWQGLFKNMLLIRAARAILFGQSKALNGIDDLSSAPGDCNAKNNGIKRITPGFIAMICCQIRFALSSAERWQPSDNDFGYQKFHEDVVAKFEPEDDDWVEETLNWWNARVFGRVEDDEDFEDSDLESGDENQDMERIRQDRIKTRQARIAAEEASAALSASTSGINSAGHSPTSDPQTAPETDNDDNSGSV